MKAQKLIDELTTAGLEITAEYIPYSKAKPQSGPDGKRWDCFTWAIRMVFNGQTLETELRKGTGLVPGNIKLALRNAGHNEFRGMHTVDSRKMLNHLLEAGKAYSDSVSARLPKPTVLEILPALVLDTSAMDAGSFEDWADEFGYSRDSREAERIYKDCIRTGLKLRRMFGDAKLNEMRSAFSEL
jgi:hypothetical protein